MTSMMKKIGLTRMAIAAAVLVSLSGGAAFASNGYSFRVERQPSSNKLTVQLVDTATGQTVANAKVFAIHTEWRGNKGVPPVVSLRIPLRPDGHGGYEYESRDVRAGAVLTVTAQMAGRPSSVWGKVRVPD